eukprot:763258-Hanusia_phi.AAC.2
MEFGKEDGETTEGEKRKEDKEGEEKIAAEREEAGEEGRNFLQERCHKSLPSMRSVVEASSSGEARTFLAIWQKQTLCMKRLMRTLALSSDRLHVLLAWVIMPRERVASELPSPQA